jgi:xanthine dehydrogenase accessory factor
MLEEKIPSRLVRYRLTAEDDGGIGGACGGDSDVFIEVFEPAGGVLVCGGGHVGRAVARVAAAAGFAVTIADEKPEPLGDEVFPPPRFLSVRPDDASILREVTESTAVVVVTRSHALDYSTLKLLVGSPAFYVGMIGSKKKVGGIMKKLEDDGVEQALLEKVYTPIGLDIGAETPAEIAVSIVSEIISARRREKPSPLSMKGQRDG